MSNWSVTFLPLDLRTAALGARNGFLSLLVIYFVHKIPDNGAQGENTHHQQED
jgi:hypothetical protein